MSPNIGYQGVSLSGQSTLTLGPGAYYMDSLSVSGEGSIVVSPAGSQVIIYPQRVTRVPQNQNPTLHQILFRADLVNWAELRVHGSNLPN